MPATLEQPPAYDQSQQLATLEELDAQMDQHMAQQAEPAKYLSAEWMMNRWDEQHGPVAVAPTSDAAPSADILTVTPTILNLPAVEAPKPTPNQQILQPGTAQEANQPATEQNLPARMARRLANALENRRTARKFVGEKVTDSKIAAKGIGLNILDSAGDNEFMPGIKEIGGNAKDIAKGFKERAANARKRVANRKTSNTPATTTSPIRVKSKSRVTA